MKLSALTFAVLLLAQQQPPQQQAPRGRMEGIVLRENTMEGVSGARVTVTRVNASTGAALPVAGTIQTFLINPTTNVPPAPGPAPNAPPPPNPPPPQPAPIPPVTTDRDGKFVVPDLEAGAYRVAVTLNGYVKQEYGQRSFTGQGTSLTLRAGEVLKDLTVRVTRAGNISGRLSDENGQPASGVPVQVLKVTYNANGTRLFQQSGTARTNDRGEYRLYWMTPGRYYLAAGTPPGPAPGAGPGAGPGPNETPDPFTFTYYPGTTDLSRATVIDVKAGADMPMDFVVPRTKLFKISGRVIGADNGPIAPQVGISLGFLRLEGGSGFIVLSQSYDRNTGEFTLRNVVPGSYALQASAGATSARAAIEVTNADLNVDLILSGGVNIAGKATVAGGGAIPSGPGNQTVVQLRPVMKGVAHWVGAVPGAPVTPADGTFRMDRVLPGEYRIVANAPGHYVKELRYENADALNSTIELSTGRPGDPTIEVVLSAGVAQIDGIVTDDKNQPLMGAQAVLIPDRNRHRTELFKAATTDQAGRFNMRDVAPGDYKLFAWESVDNFGYFEPSFLQPYENLGKAIKVDEGGKLNVDAKVIPEKR